MQKNKIIAGVDEVGRGCLAGPVVSAAVILKKGIQLKRLKDSKKLSYKQRIEVSEDIRNNSYFAIGIASVKEIEKLNILQASLLSMRRAILNLSKRPDLVFVDGIFAPKVSYQCKTFIKGDENGKLTKLIGHIGLFALVWGFLGQMIGLVTAFDSIGAFGDMSPAILAAGIKVALLNPIFGMVVFLIARLGIIIFAFKK